MKHNINGHNVHISTGNIKMGQIPSISLPPVVSCPKNVPCAKNCYACKMCRIYKSVRNSYAENWETLNSDMQAYFAAVRSTAFTARYFRFHVSGDIPNYEYFCEMVKVAEEFPNTHFLAFTKAYSYVNMYISENGDLPENLKIIFSEWEDGSGWTVENPHNLPTSTVIFKGQTVPENVKLCGGNCFECACRGVGCWELKSGETIGFHQH